MRNKTGMNLLIISMTIAQPFFGYVHLRRFFEHEDTLSLIAGMGSIFVFILCLFWLFRNRHP